jgi:hypothetical protein
MTTGLGDVEVVNARDLDKWLGRRTRAVPSGEISPSNLPVSFIS